MNRRPSGRVVDRIARERDPGFIIKSVTAARAKAFKFRGTGMGSVDVSDLRAGSWSERLQYTGMGSGRSCHGSALGWQLSWLSVTGQLHAILILAFQTHDQVSYPSHCENSLLRRGLYSTSRRVADFYICVKCKSVSTRGSISCGWQTEQAVSITIELHTQVLFQISFKVNICQWQRKRHGSASREVKTHAKRVAHESD